MYVPVSTGPRGLVCTLNIINGAQSTQHNKYFSAKNLIQFSCFYHGWISFEISTYFQGKQKEESSSQQQ